ncbi:hypothetical protein HK100_000508 [Physocladia obscura]|uniref:Proteasome activator PA28 C-terminal domain-containing protein n=1 Tax=Physocladia obscura TaxID=109957 RepID=A0AAD5XCH6_9FUNG|nr:hypothetical protein HK100_000508 [Physocladia obscura]
MLASSPPSSADETTTTSTLTTAHPSIHELSLPTSPTALHASFAQLKQTSRSAATHEIRVSLVRRVLVLQQILSTNGTIAKYNKVSSRVASAPAPAYHSLSLSDSGDSDVNIHHGAVEKDMDENPNPNPTRTPKKRRRVSTNAADFAHPDPSETTPVPSSRSDNNHNHSSASLPRSAPATFFASAAATASADKIFLLEYGVNTDVKHVSALVKREISLVRYSVSCIKTWVQLDNIKFKSFDVLNEICAIEKWLLEALESLSGYHSKRAQILNEIAAQKRASSSSRSMPDLNEAISDMDDTQMHHLIATLTDLMQSCAVLYARLEACVE